MLIYRRARGRAKAAQGSAGLRVLLSFSVLGAGYFAHVWRDPTVRRAGLGDDPGLFLFWLKWFPFAIRHLQAPFVTDWLIYPSGVNAMANTSMPLAAIALAPVSSTVGLTVAYNVLITAAPVLSGWCMYLAIRRFSAGHLGPVIGGLVYGFSPYLAPQLMAHAQVALCVFPPLAVIALHEILVVQRRSPFRAGAAFGALVAAQLLVGEELVASTAVMAVILVAVLAVWHRHEVRQRAGRAARSLATATAVVVGVAAYPLAIQVAGAQHTLGRLNPADQYGTDLTAFAVPSRFLWFHTSASDAFVGRFTAGPLETGAYIGIPLLVVLPLLIAVAWRRPMVRLALVLAIAAAILSLGPHLQVNGTITRLPLPGLLFAHLPLLDNMIASRLSLYMWVAVALIVGLAVDVLQAEWPRRRSLIATIVVTLALVPLVPAAPAYAAQPTPDFFHSSAIDRIPDGSVVLVDPFATGSRSRAMVWQAEAGLRFRMPEGYAIVPSDAGPRFGPPPSATQSVLVGLDGGDPLPAVTASLRAEILGELRSWHVSTVIVGPGLGAVPSRSLFTSLLGRPPEHIDGVDVWFGVPGG